MTVRSSITKPIVLSLALVLGGAVFQARAADPPAPSLVYFNHNFQDVPLAPYPGVTVASLKVPAGTYLMHVKLRYRPQLGGGATSVFCAFVGTGTGGLDTSAARVQLIGEPGIVDGVMMDYLAKYEGDDPEVRVQCYGDPSVHVVNSQFAAVLSAFILQ